MDAELLFQLPYRRDGRRLSVRKSGRYVTDSLTMRAIIQLLIYVLFKMFKI